MKFKVTHGIFKNNFYNHKNRKKPHYFHVYLQEPKEKERERVPSFISNGCIPNQMDTERKRYILLALSERAL